MSYYLPVNALNGYLLPSGSGKFEKGAYYSAKEFGLDHFLVFATETDGCDELGYDYGRFYHFLEVQVLASPIRAVKCTGGYVPETYKPTPVNAYIVDMIRVL